ncbi:hypothetical protein C8Q79DRAFT_1116295 [Trametes meyenii]|nr:hypothetical protein C8Q79DRAFT_1116295 [Trametes meyenii]
MRTSIHLSNASVRVPAFRPTAMVLPVGLSGPRGPLKSQYNGNNRVEAYRAHALDLVAVPNDTVLSQSRRGYATSLGTFIRASSLTAAGAYCAAYPITDDGRRDHASRPYCLPYRVIHLSWNKASAGKQCERRPDSGSVVMAQPAEAWGNVHIGPVSACRPPCPP